MAMAPESIARAAELGGAGLAVTCGACRWIAENHDFISALGMVAGILIGVIGMIWRGAYEAREDRRREERHQIELERYNGSHRQPSSIIEPLNTEQA